MPEILIDEYAVVPIDAVQQHPGNARNGDVELIGRSLEAHGQFVPIVVQRSTGFILKGNHTWEAARDGGSEAVAVAYVDVDDAEARAIMLDDNYASDVATYNDPALLAALDEYRRETGSLDGVLFTDAAHQDLATRLGAESALDALGEGERSDGGMRADPRRGADAEVVVVSFSMAEVERTALLAWLDAQQRERGMDSRTHTLLSVMHDYD